MDADAGEQGIGEPDGITEGADVLAGCGDLDRDEIAPEGEFGIDAIDDGYAGDDVR
jgi:hypothetical protein